MLENILHFALLFHCNHFTFAFGTLQLLLVVLLYVRIDCFKRFANLGRNRVLSPLGTLVFGSWSNDLLIVDTHYVSSEQHTQAGLFEWTSSSL